LPRWQQRVSGRFGGHIGLPIVSPGLNEFIKEIPNCGLKPSFLTQSSSRDGCRTSRCAYGAWRA
jgi:hypothetical protein